MPISLDEIGCFRLVIGELSNILVIVRRGDNYGVVVIRERGHIDVVTVAADSRVEHQLHCGLRHDVHVIVTREAICNNNNFLSVTVKVNFRHISWRIVLTVIAWSLML